MPQIKVKSLTSYQTAALKSVSHRIPDLVRQITTSSVILDDTTTNCLAAIQNVMNEILEAEGDSSVHRSLKAVRNKLADASRTGESKFVKVFPEHAPPVPPVLNGRMGFALPGEPIEEEPIEEEPIEEEPIEEEPEQPTAPEQPKPTAPAPRSDTAAAKDSRRKNFEFMLYTAPSPSARRTWERQLAQLTT